MMDASDRTRLLALARRALEASVHDAPRPDPGAGPPSSGVFVTIHVRDELRGCLGSLAGGEPLPAAVARLAAAVAREDVRFEPLQPHELPWTTIEISILTPPERVDDPAAIEVGVDGLIVARGRQRGLLLPQVAVEHGWSREMFLAQTCVKAGLPADAWRGDAEIQRFRAEVFGEAAAPGGR